MAAARIWIDGRLVDPARATLSALDHGVTVGDGVFESMKVLRDGDGALQAFALTRHLRRLRRSADGLRLRLPLDDEGLRAAVAAVLHDADTTHHLGGSVDDGQGVGRVRITVTGGIGPMGSGRGHGVPTVIIAATPLVARPPHAAVATVPWRRNEHSAVAGIKTTSYAENVVALAHAEERGADEAIFANTAGFLCEGAGSNVVVGRGGRLVTPPLRSGCLAGVTRELLLEVADVVEQDLPLDALAAADEAFLTSSTREVQPIAVVDGRALPACPGPRTRAAAAAFAELVAAGLDP